MNKNEPIAKDFNIEEANQVEVPIKVVRISNDLEMIKDNTGTIHDPDVLYFYVSKGGNVRHALRDAMGVLKTQKDKFQAVLKYNGVEVSFGRDEKYLDILDYIYAIEEFLDNSKNYENNPNFTQGV